MTRTSMTLLALLISACGIGPDDVQVWDCLSTTTCGAPGERAEAWKEMLCASENELAIIRRDVQGACEAYCPEAECKLDCMAIGELCE